MVNFYPGFLSPEAARLSRDMFQAARDLRARFKDDKEFQEALRAWAREHPMPPVSVHTVVDHIEHIIKTAGIDHVGLGSDFDGINAVPRQLEDVSCYPYITQELLNRGYKKEEILKVLGGNILRVLRAAEEVSKRAKG
jgi:membrane dipeptidase